MTGRKYVVLIHVAILLAASWFVYSGNRYNGYFEVDDKKEIILNTALDDISLKGLVGFFIEPDIFSFYAPLKRLAFAVNIALAGGRNPWALHLGNDLLYLVVVACCYLFLLVLTEKPSYSFLVSLLFAVHPCHSRIVNHISGAGHILAALFMFLSLLFYILYSKRASRAGAPWAGLAFIFASALSYTAGLLSWPTAITLPAILLAYEIFVIDQGKSVNERAGGIAARLLPFGVLALVYLVLIQTAFKPGTTYTFVGNVYDLSAWHKSVGLFFQHFAHIIVPTVSDFGGDILLPSRADPAYYLPRLLVIAVYILAVVKLYPKDKWIVLAPAITFFSLIQVSLFIHADRPLALHHLLFSSTGLYMVLILIYERLVGRIRNPAAAAAALILLLAAITAFAINTRGRTQVWSRHIDALMADEAIKVDKKGPYSYYRSSLAKIGENDIGAAVLELEKAVAAARKLSDKFYPQYKREALAASYYKLMTVYSQMGRTADVEKICYAWAESDPWLSNPYYSLSMHYAEIGRRADAVRVFAETKAKFPAMPSEIKELWTDKLYPVEPRPAKPEPK